MMQVIQVMFALTAGLGSGAGWPAGGESSRTTTGSTGGRPRGQDKQRLYRGGMYITGHVDPMPGISGLTHDIPSIPISMYNTIFPMDRKDKGASRTSVS